VQYKPIAKILHLSLMNTKTLKLWIAAAPFGVAVIVLGGRTKMKLPKPSPEFCRAYGLARAIAFPGLYLSSDSIDAIPDYPSNLLDIQMAALACTISTWPKEKIENMCLQAKAEFLAENASQIAAIKKSLREGVPEKTKPAPTKYTELASKISISL